MSVKADHIAEFRALQLEFFQIDDAVIQRIRRLKSCLSLYVDKAVDTLFDHLRSNPMVADYFADRDNIDFLSSNMRAHCGLIFEARYDDAYFDSVEAMGRRHAKLEFPSFVYTSGYSNMLLSIQRQASQAGIVSPDDLFAMSRVTHLDLELAQAAFFQAKIDKLDALNADAARLRAHITDQSDAA